MLYDIVIIYFVFSLFFSNLYSIKKFRKKSIDGECKTCLCDWLNYFFLLLLYLLTSHRVHFFKKVMSLLILHFYRIPHRYWKVRKQTEIQQFHNWLNRFIFNLKKVPSLKTSLLNKEVISYPIWTTFPTLIWNQEL